MPLPDVAGGRHRVDLGFPFGRAATFGLVEQVHADPHGQRAGDPDPEDAQRVHIAALQLTVEFAAGEEMLTEVSCKFRAESVAAELAQAGLRRTRWWTDDAGDFGLFPQSCRGSLCRAVGRINLASLYVMNAARIAGGV